MSAWFIDAGFGLNTLRMLQIRPDGSVCAVDAVRTPKGIAYEPVPIEAISGLGNKDLPSR